MLYMKFGYNWPSGFSGEMLEIVDGRRMAADGACLNYKLPRAFDSGGLKRYVKRICDFFQTTANTKL